MDSNDSSTTSDESHRDVEGVDDIIDLSSLAAEDVVARLDQWEQGHLVSGLRLFWATTRGFDVLASAPTASPSDGGWDVQRLAHEDDAVVNKLVDSVSNILDWGIVTSQTCDVAATGPGAKHPTVQVSPLVRLDPADEALIQEVKDGKRLNLVYVPEVPEEGEWAADLRISLPVSKALLLENSQVPMSGFSSSQGVLEFAGQIAWKVRRPALHEYLSGPLLKDLRKVVDVHARRNAEWVEQVEQFRIITDGDPLRPKSVQILVITDEKLNAVEKLALRNWRKSKRNEIRDKVDGAVFEPLRFRVLGEVSAVEYRDAFPLYVPELGRRAFS